MSKPICSDIGHCQTSVAQPDIQAGGQGKYTVRRVHPTVGQDEVILSQIILTQEQLEKLQGVRRPDFALLSELGEFRIGNKLPITVKDGEKFIYFKVPPKDFDTPCEGSESGVTHGAVMACFVYALVDGIIRHGDVCTEDERGSLELLIGCPATTDWTDEQAREEYAELVRNATGVQSVRILPESRAAMFSSVDNERSGISAANGAVVFDFGSSTADCTYMLLGRRILEFSWTLGASKIEKTMVKKAVRLAQENGSFVPTAASIRGAEDAMRRAKEGFYSGQYEFGDHPISSTFVDTATGEKHYPQTFINAEFMQEVTGKELQSVLCDSTTTLTGSWQALCRAFFVEAKNRIERETYTVRNEDGTEKRCPCTVSNIVLTGGASQMDFIETICKEVFPGVDVIKEKNPSHTVSNGLGWVSIADDNLQACVDAARDGIEKAPECGFDRLQSKIEDAVFSYVSKIALAEADAWANAPGDDKTFRDLQNSITHKMEEEQTQQELQNICADIIKAWKEKLSTAMEGAVNGQVRRIYSEQVASGLIIPSDIWKGLQDRGLNLDQINVADVLEKIDVTPALAKIGQGIIVVIFAAMGYAVNPLVGAIVGGLIGALVGEPLNDTNMDKPRKSNKRKRLLKPVKKEIQNGKDEMLKDVNVSFEQYRKEYGEVLNGALKNAFEIVTLKRFGVEDR